MSMLTARERAAVAWRDAENHPRGRPFGDKEHTKAWWAERRSAAYRAARDAANRALGGQPQQFYGEPSDAALRRIIEACDKAVSEIDAALIARQRAEDVAAERDVFVQARDIAQRALGTGRHDDDHLHMLVVAADAMLDALDAAARVPA
jgi:hypothetical protein